MFGEDSLSESPRVPSPWDPFLPSPPSESTSLEARKNFRDGIPKLVPEIEEGNIEYKLKLTDISSARFARLVTQLKWRLLEGGGQAYYELGVADSGALIGLSRSDLEQSLETLELMAGEIGASVIVVKEIEVPSSMVALADKVSAYIDPETGSWTEKMTNKRHRVPYATDSDPVTPNGTEPEVDSTDFADIDEPSSTVSTPNSPPQLGSGAAMLTPYAHRLATSNPHRPTAQSSPSMFPIDDDLALFSMEPEPSLDANDADVEDTIPDGLADIPDLSLDIEITSVYKPRPIRRRVHLISGPGSTIGRPARRVHKIKDKKPIHSWHEPASSPTKSDKGDFPHVPNKQEAKALHRRIIRDRRREEKRQVVAALTESGAATVAGQLDKLPHDGDVTIDPLDPSLVRSNVMVAELEALHVDVWPADAAILDESEPAINDMEGPISPTATAVDVADSFSECNIFNGGTITDARESEPRLIVEALVVRKMSLEEGYLDFGNLGGFSLS